MDLSDYIKEMSKFEKHSKLYTVRNNWVYKDTWHRGWVCFSYNKELFGFVRQSWYPCGGWEAPEAEYDFEWERGIQIYDDEYKQENIDELKQLWDKSDPLIDKQIICIPVFWKYPEMVGHTIDNKIVELFNGTKEEL